MQLTLAIARLRGHSRILYSDILPRLKAEASTIYAPAKANLRLTGAMVKHRCPDAFNVNRRVVIAVNGQTALTNQRSIA